MSSRKIKIEVLVLAVIIFCVLALTLWWRDDSVFRSRPVTMERQRSSIELVAEPARHQAEQRAQEVKSRFDQAVLMLHAKRFDHAVTALHRVLELAPTLPEAHVNMGFAMLGLGSVQAACDFFYGAIDLRPQQANAYFGLAIALEALNDKPAALGAMRTYIHLSRAGDPYVRKARAAIWEWQAQGERERRIAANTGEVHKP